MRTEHKGDGVTTYIYSPNKPAHDALLEVRASVERIEALCRDMMTSFGLLVDLLSEAHELSIHGAARQNGSDSVAGSGESGN